MEPLLLLIIQRPTADHLDKMADASLAIAQISLASIILPALFESASIAQAFVGLLISLIALTLSWIFVSYKQRL